MVDWILKWWIKKSDRQHKQGLIEDRHKTEVRLLAEQVKLRDLQIKNLVAENQRNFERIKAETAAFSADVVKATNSRS